jgi:hypothetical protein
LLLIRGTGVPEVENEAVDRRGTRLPEATGRRGVDGSAPMDFEWASVGRAAAGEAPIEVDGCGDRIAFANRFASTSLFSKLMLIA